MVDLEGPILYLISNGYDEFYASNHIDVQKHLKVTRQEADMLLYGGVALFNYEVVQTLSEDR